MVSIGLGYWILMYSQHESRGHDVWKVFGVSKGEMMDAWNILNMFGYEYRVVIPCTNLWLAHQQSAVLKSVNIAISILVKLRMLVQNFDSLHKRSVCTK